MVILRHQSSPPLKNRCQYEHRCKKHQLNDQKVANLDRAVANDCERKFAHHRRTKPVITVMATTNRREKPYTKPKSNQSNRIESNQTIEWNRTESNQTIRRNQCDAGDKLSKFNQMFILSASLIYFFFHLPNFRHNFFVCLLFIFFLVFATFIFTLGTFFNFDSFKIFQTFRYWVLLS